MRYSVTQLLGKERFNMTQLMQTGLISCCHKAESCYFENMAVFFWVRLVFPPVSVFLHALITKHIPQD